jgi:hypothetical protein
MDNLKRVAQEVDTLSAQPIIAKEKLSEYVRLKKEQKKAEVRRASQQGDKACARKNDS